jgi:hypothetical protein
MSVIPPHTRVLVNTHMGFMQKAWQHPSCTFCWTSPTFNIRRSALHVDLITYLIISNAWVSFFQEMLFHLWETHIRKCIHTCLIYLWIWKFLKTLHHFGIMYTTCILTEVHVDSLEWELLLFWEVNCKIPQSMSNW